ncbi:unnamed protein product, partial [Gongylonema pulchrum]|uniref:Transposase n=1 Tax=Gongylonema pulchrum TaxID=637853 RepID=A0A183F1N6_9BILA
MQAKRDRIERTLTEQLPDSEGFEWWPFKASA